MPIEEHLRRLIQGLNREKVVLIQEKETDSSAFKPRLVQQPVKRELLHKKRKISFRILKSIRSLFRTQQ